MREGAILRLFVFRPARSDAAFDATLREDVLPRLMDMPGIVDAFVGRHGPGSDDERVIASIWESRRAMTAGLGASSIMAPYQPDQAAEVVASRLDILGVRVAVRHERADPPVILRVFRGEAKQGQLEGYIQEADMGAKADAESNAGLAALYLGSQPPTRFITVSAWTSWSSIEVATGGDVRRPVATRHSERLVGADVDHYEMLPNAIRPPVRMARTGSSR